MERCGALNLILSELNWPDEFLDHYVLISLLLKIHCLKDMLDLTI